MRRPRSWDWSLVLWGLAALLAGCALLAGAGSPLSVSLMAGALVLVAGAQLEALRARRAAGRWPWGKGSHRA